MVDGCLLLLNGSYKKLLHLYEFIEGITSTERVLSLNIDISKNKEEA